MHIEIYEDTKKQTGETVYKFRYVTDSGEIIFPLRGRETAKEAIQDAVFIREHMADAPMIMKDKEGNIISDLSLYLL